MFIQYSLYRSDNTTRDNYAFYLIEKWQMCYFRALKVNLPIRWLLMKVPSAQTRRAANKNAPECFVSVCAFLLSCQSIINFIS